MLRAKALSVLQQRTHARADALLGAHAGWPCRSGCDACCRRLARVPQLTELEWEPLERALRALPAAEQSACLRAAEALREHVREHGEREPVACPLLDLERGVCRVYASRPIACRSYGFYAGHSHDAWCSQVAAHVAPVRHGLIFGNLDALERDLLQCGGERRDLLALLDL